MRTTLTALATAATLAVTAIATPTTAEAQWRGWGWRGPAFVGGLAAGAFIGATFARPYAYGGYYGGPYVSSYGYYGGPYTAYGYYGGPYATYASPVYTGYPVYSGYYAAGYSCGRTAWDGYRWVRYYAC